MCGHRIQRPPNISRIVLPDHLDQHVLDLSWDVNQIRFVFIGHVSGNWHWGLPCSAWTEDHPSGELPYNPDRSRSTEQGKLALQHPVLSHLGQVMCFRRMSTTSHEPPSPQPGPILAP